jgi:type IV pilus assembly protein PilE|tara:strand:- start:10325 stop:10732 length:408 start_codon:yes stop_codon:yes gene_type:complete
MSMRNNTQGFSLMELLLVLALVSTILSLVVPSWRQHQLSVGRQQAWLQLQRISLQQQMWHIQHGDYFADIGLAIKPAEQVRYRYQVQLTETGFLLSATVNANGPQRHDAFCWRLTLSDTGEMKSLSKGGGIQHCK